MFISRIPGLLKYFYRTVTWELPAEGKVVYLTFDDGPTVEVTDWVLEKLKEYHAVGTFFCLGKNVAENPKIFERIRNAGHAVGNHSYSHMKGFSNSLEAYRENIDRAAALIPSRLFRPPYGRILPVQAKEITRDYKVIMWSVLSVDYNPKVSGKQVVKNVLNHFRPGSIIVFHDSVKASGNLYYALPRVLDFLKENGYKTAVIPGA